MYCRHAYFWICTWIRVISFFLSFHSEKVVFELTSLDRGKTVVFCPQIWWTTAEDFKKSVLTYEKDRQRKNAFLQLRHLKHDSDWRLTGWNSSDSCTWYTGVVLSWSPGAASTETQLPWRQQCGDQRKTFCFLLSGWMSNMLVHFSTEWHHSSLLCSSVSGSVLFPIWCYIPSSSSMQDPGSYLSWNVRVCIFCLL